MKTEIDRLMEEKGIDALFVIGAANHNAPMVYFTGVVHVSDAYLLKARGKPPILFYQTMERDEATRTGLQTKCLDDYDPEALIKKFDGDLVKVRAERLKLIFEEFQVGGKVSLYGTGDVGSFYGIFRQAQSVLEDVQFVSEPSNTSVLTMARMTKGNDEIEQIRKMGEITVATVKDVAGFLQSHRAEDGVLVDRQGETLTIGEVKRRIDLWLAMRGAENPERTIFAIGSDAGVPHSAGIDDHPVEVGVPIIFDLFPCQSGGGYFFDFTRTWCLGYASAEMRKIYDDVRQVYEQVYAAIEPNRLCSDFQTLTCELFQEMGHPTIQSDKKTLKGYVHSLAHGIGLDVHEGPGFYKRDENKDILLPGTVITVEPGLYYPDEGIGARIEDTVWVRPDGELETLADYPKELVLEIEGA